MEEILEKEKDLKQLVEITQILFERSQDLTHKTDDQANQLTMLMSEQSKLVETSHQNEMLSNSLKERITQLERINFDLERQVTEAASELTDLKNASRKHREDQAMQEDAYNEWQSKMHDKDQEMKMMSQRYEAKLKSLQAELEERDTNLAQRQDTITQLNDKCKKFQSEVEKIKEKKNKYHNECAKYQKMNQRLQNEKT